LPLSWSSRGSSAWATTDLQRQADEGAAEHQPQNERTLFIEVEICGWCDFVTAFLPKCASMIKGKWNVPAIVITDILCSGGQEVTIK